MSTQTPTALPPTDWTRPILLNFDGKVKSVDFDLLIRTHPELITTKLETYGAGDDIALEEVQGREAHQMTNFLNFVHGGDLRCTSNRQFELGHACLLAFRLGCPSFHNKVLETFVTAFNKRGDLPTGRFVKWLYSCNEEAVHAPKKLVVDIVAWEGDDGYFMSEPAVARIPKFVLAVAIRMAPLRKGSKLSKMKPYATEEFVGLYGFKKRIMVDLE